MKSFHCLSWPPRPLLQVINDPLRLIQTLNLLRNKATDCLSDNELTSLNEVYRQSDWARLTCRHRYLRQSQCGLVWIKRLNWREPNLIISKVHILKLDDFLTDTTGFQSSFQITVSLWSANRSWGHGAVIRACCLVAEPEAAAASKKVPACIIAASWSKARIRSSCSAPRTDIVLIISLIFNQATAIKLKNPSWNIIKK